MELTLHIRIRRYSGQKYDYTMYYQLYHSVLLPCVALWEPTCCLLRDLLSRVFASVLFAPNSPSPLTNE
jgi:hypothetical protein